MIDVVAFVLSKYTAQCPPPIQLHRLSFPAVSLALKNNRAAPFASRLNVPEYAASHYGTG